MSDDPHNGWRDDYLFAWSCALNVNLYDDDPGPRQMVVGGPGEQRTVDRRQRLIDAYARDVLVHVDAELDRLATVVAEVKRKHAERAARDAP
ncbi:MAG: hypothetical protein GEV09_22600 [Pseudonocardiaceae bacterium]|nr:hypothetical protein [Pseudonocardiaceae bacterium]